MFVRKTLLLPEEENGCKVTRKRDAYFSWCPTTQRNGAKFLTAIGIIREGRIGKIKKVTCNIGGPKADIQIDHLTNMIGICGSGSPLVDYIKERCHKFRWWYDTPIGKMTDWGLTMWILPSGLCNRTEWGGGSFLGIVGEHHP